MSSSTSTTTWTTMRRHWRTEWRALFLVRWISLSSSTSFVYSNLSYRPVPHPRCVNLTQFYPLTHTCVSPRPLDRISSNYHVADDDQEDDMGIDFWFFTPTPNSTTKAIWEHSISSLLEGRSQHIVWPRPEKEVRLKFNQTALMSRLYAGSDGNVPGKIGHLLRARVCRSRAQPCIKLFANKHPFTIQFIYWCRNYDRWPRTRRTNSQEFHPLEIPTQCDARVAHTLGQTRADLRDCSVRGNDNRPPTNLYDKVWKSIRVSV